MPVYIRLDMRYGSAFFPHLRIEAHVCNRFRVRLAGIGLWECCSGYFVSKYFIYDGFLMCVRWFLNYGLAHIFRFYRKYRFIRLKGASLGAEIQSSHAKSVFVAGCK